MKLYYIWDAYCGWCHGFGRVLDTFVNQHPELELVVLSGGLFDAGRRIGDYPHIPSANQQISQIYGVTFGPAYQELLAQGDLVMNSLHAAAGFAVLKERVASRLWVTLAKALQEAFYHQGQSLSEIGTYQAVAQQFDLDAEWVCQQVEAAWAGGSQLEDVAQVRAMGVPGFPTVLLEKDGRFYDLRRGASRLEELETNYQEIQNHA